MCIWESDEAKAQMKRKLKEDCLYLPKNMLLSNNVHLEKHILRPSKLTHNLNKEGLK